MAFNLKSNIDPVNVPIRPLKGMNPEVSPSLVEPGAFVNLSNYYATKRGIRKRDGYGYYAGGNQIADDDQPIVAIAPVWKTDGSQVACMLTSRYLYEVTGYSVPTGKYWTYTTGYISALSTTVTGYGTNWDASGQYILAGDYIVLDADGSGDGPEEIEIDSVDDHNTLTLVSAPTGTYSATEHIEYGDGENASSPTLDGGTSGLSNGTWARTSVQKKGGVYSWVLNKSTATGAGDADNYLTDNTNNTDMHGLTAGATYYVSLWMYSDAAAVTNATVTIQEYYAAAWHDVISFDPDAASTWELKTSEITLNGSTTAVTILVQIASAEDAGTLLYVDDISIVDTEIDYAIRRRFNVDPDYLLDYDVVDNKLLIADHTRPVYSYDGSSFTIFDAALTYIPACLTFFDNRLWIGNTIESGTYYRHRVRWSSLTDHTLFDSADYLDLPYGSGVLKRIIGLNQLIVLYFEDSIYAGRQSNLNWLPYFFTQINSGSVGLIGARAVCEVPNGHIFVGQSGIYFLNTGGIEPINCPVIDEMIGNCSDPSRIYVVSDPVHDRVLFGFPEAGSYISKIWMFNLKSQQWSYENVSATSLSNPLLTLGLTWEDLPGILSQDDWDVGMTDFDSWDSIGIPTASNRVFRTENGYTYAIEENRGNDVSTNVTTLFETGDIDLNNPDDDKTYLRFSIKLAERPSINLSFATWYSIDGGSNWENIGPIAITTGEREGRADFIATGSVIRFRCSESSTSDPYTVIEYGVRVRGRGLEIEYP